MKNKCNLVYTIFDQSIVVSGNLRINTVQGYRVVKKSNVLDFKDVDRWLDAKGMQRALIPMHELWKFDCPTTGESWYVNSFLLAHFEKGQYGYAKYLPRIVFVYLGNRRYATPSMKDFKKYGEFFLDTETSSINFVSELGYLSTPDHAVCNYSFRCDTVKLPFIV